VTAGSAATVDTFARLAADVAGRAPRLGHTRLVAVDGPSGAGKTTFAARLAAAMPAGVTVAVVPTDAFLDGWAPPMSVWPRLRAEVLDAVAAGRQGAYRSYDWNRRRRGAEVTVVPVPAVLILEGVTSGRAEIRPSLVSFVFVTADRAARIARAVYRDGTDTAEPLRAWHKAEDSYFVTERAAEHADLVVDGTSDLRHDPDKEFVRLR
jgi:uridine kinase